MSNHIIYCRHCGAEMKHEKVHLGFDTHTGSKVFGNKWSCPNVKWFKWRCLNAKWYKLVFDLQHDNYDDFSSLG